MQHRQLPQQGSIHQEGHSKVQKQCLITFGKNLHFKYFKESLMQVQQNQRVGVMLKVQPSPCRPNQQHSENAALSHYTPPTLQNSSYKTQAQA